MKRRFVAFFAVSALLLGSCKSSSTADPLGSSSSSSGSGSSSSSSGGSSSGGASSSVGNSGAGGSSTSSPPSAATVPITFVTGSGGNQPLVLGALSSGLFGSYNGLTLQAQASVGATISMPSGLAGNPGSLRVSTISNQQAPYLILTFCRFAPASCASSSLLPSFPMFTSSRLEFDLFIETPLADINNVSVYFGPDNHKAQRRLTSAELALATAGFTRFSFPGSSFQIPATPVTNTQVASVFQITLVKIIGTSTQGFAVNDVRWTP